MFSQCQYSPSPITSKESWATWKCQLTFPVSGFCHGCGCPQKVPEHVYKRLGLAHAVAHRSTTLMKTVKSRMSMSMAMVSREVANTQMF